MPCVLRSIAQCMGCASRPTIRHLIEQRTGISMVSDLPDLVQ